LVNPALHVLTAGVSGLVAHAAHLDFGAIALVCLAVAFVSAVVPWVNAELLIVGLAAVARSNQELTLFVLLASLGQMAGKCIVFSAGRRGGNASTGKAAELLTRWRHRASRTPWSPVALVAISSTVGIPPFYATSAVAGALRMDVRWFLIAGTCGRIVRFGALAFGATFWSWRI
jgi:membrane protein YqaA with SNARE-associated domain